MPAGPCRGIPREPRRREVDGLLLSGPERQPVAQEGDVAGPLQVRGARRREGREDVLPSRERADDLVLEESQGRTGAGGPLQGPDLPRLGGGEDRLDPL